MFSNPGPTMFKTFLGSALSVLLRIRKEEIENDSLVLWPCIFQMPYFNSLPYVYIRGVYWIFTSLKLSLTGWHPWCSREKRIEICIKYVQNFLDFLFLGLNYFLIRMHRHLSGYWRESRNEFKFWRWFRTNGLGKSIDLSSLS